MDQSQAKTNIGYLKTLAKDMVAVLLNVFSKLPREQRGQVGDVIGAWVGIMTEQVSWSARQLFEIAADMQDVIGVYQTVTTHLSTNLTSTQAAPGTSPISHTMLDLLIIFVPHLPQAQSAALFTATATETMLEHHDATVQKKSYRLLKRLLEAGRLGEIGQGEKLEEFVVRIGEAGTGIGPGAQRVSPSRQNGATQLMTRIDSSSCRPLWTSCLEIGYIWFQSCSPKQFSAPRKSMNELGMLDSTCWSSWDTRWPRVVLSSNKFHRKKTKRSCRMVSRLPWRCPYC